MTRRNKVDNDRRIRQFDEDPESLRELYEHYRDTCTENGGSAAWSRETSVLVLELMRRLGEKDKDEHD